MKAKFLVSKEALVQRKNIVLILLKQTQNFAWVYVIIFIIVNIFVNEKEVFKFKADNRNVNFRTQFCLGSISNGFITIILLINLKN